MLLNDPLTATIQDRSIVLSVSETGEQIRWNVVTGYPAQVAELEVAYPVNTDGTHCFVGGKTAPFTEGSYHPFRSGPFRSRKHSFAKYEKSSDIQRLANDFEDAFKICETCGLQTCLKYVSYDEDLSYANSIIMACLSTIRYQIG
ncbi:hypothetical protein IV203_016233 [Nitzschia inconspicua]|uniref:Uncharacterized protein n=1 Tax=Nitzschia inconspicua TaxID=303405 RepID=A0A9K3K828_9STRA|nr:hypothetical protein IV203_017448 [Nitzschia inconspicua]KAG7347528.1 hypothetical protein IV203_016233 [Nitzschia inconspicua]